MGVLRVIGRVLLDITVLLLILMILPGLPPHTKVSYYETDETLPFEGPLAKNDILNDAGRILDGKITGPESVASRRKNELFTSLHNGKILRIWGKNFDHFQSVATIGPGCDGPWQERICGRPLGMRFAPDGKLIVVDAYLGLFSLDVDTGEKESLFDITKEIDGAVPKIPDDLDIDEDGNIYWSDASSVVDLSDGMIEMLSDPSGRLIKFDSKTKTNTILLKDVHFANGVQLSPDRDFVLVSETFRSRILRHWLNGPNAGKTDIFVDKLPGKPDNLRAKKDGGYYVSLVSVDDKEKVDAVSVLAKLPYLRKLLMRLVAIPRFLFDTVSKVYPNQITESAAYQLFHLQPIAELIASQSAVIVELDADGNIVGSLQGNNGNVRFISETDQVGDFLFFGSPYNDYLGYLRVDYTEDEEEEEVGPSMEVDGEGVKMKVDTDNEEKEIKEVPQEVVEEIKEEEVIPSEEVKKTISEAVEKAIPVEDVVTEGKEEDLEDKPVKSSPQTPTGDKDIDHLSTPPVEEEPAHPVVEEPTPPVEDELTPVKEEPTPPIVEAPTPPIKEEPKEPTPPVKEEPKEPTPPIKEEPKEPTPPIKEEPKEPTPQVEESAPPVEDPTAPVKEEL